MGGFGGRWYVWLLATLLLLALLVVGIGALSGQVPAASPPATAPAPQSTAAPAAPSPTPPSVAASPQATATPRAEATAVEVTTVAEGLDTPWALAFAPDGRLFFTERPGVVRVVVEGRLRPEPLIRLPANETAEGGVMGLAVDPGFPAQPYLYVMYTYDAPGGGARNRVVRLEVAGETAREERVLVDDIPGGGIHNGGRVKVGPDGKLYVTAGDAGQSGAAQSLGTLAGKILRLNLDGSIPEDNPFADSPIYSYGHRNPQGLAWQPVTGRLYATEHGPSGNDEVNLIEPGNNYGWPTVTGMQHGTFTAPLITFTPSVAPAGAAFVDGGLLPQWADSLFFTTLRGTHLHRLRIDARDPTRVTQNERLYEGEYGRLRDVVQGPDGALYLATSNRDGRGSPEQSDDRILRLGPSFD
ncbi:MAG: PQQ-dependent sugar dehydrogenase [Chloroflexota bacterium]